MGNKIYMSVLYIIAFGLIGWYSNWQTALGVFFFGWAMNADNRIKRNS